MHGLARSFHKNEAPDTQSVASLPFDDLFGFRPRKTSHGLGWAGLFAMLAENPIEKTPQMRVPALHEDQLVIHLQNPVQLSCKIGSAAFSAVSRPGTFSLAPRCTQTTWQVEGGTAGVVVICLEHERFTRLALEALDEDAHAVEIVEKTVQEDAFLHQIGRAIAMEVEAPGAASQLLMDALLQTLHIHLYRHYVVFPRKLTEVRGALPVQALKNVLEYIQAHLSSDLRLEEVASVAHLSSFHFSRLFKHSMGMPIFQYVLQKRLEHSRELLLTGKYSVTQAAEHSGFNSISHFSRQFKRYFGVSPAQFLKHSKPVQIESKKGQINLF